MGKKNIVFQQRDYEFLYWLGMLGCLSSQYAFERWYFDPTCSTATLRSQQVYFNRRLVEFVRFGLIDSTAVVYNGLKGIRRYPNILRLLEHGADVVEEATGERPPRPAHSDPPRAMTMHHRAGVSRTILTCLDAAAALGKAPLPFFVEQDRIAGTQLADPAHVQHVLYEVFLDGFRRMPVRPDAGLLFELPDQARNKLCGYLEYDRSTETKKQFLAKKTNGGYPLLLDAKQALFRRHFPEATMARILFVVPSDERRNHLTEWLGGHREASYSLIAVESDVVPSKVLTAKVWLNLRTGKIVSMLGVRQPQKRESD